MPFDQDPLSDLVETVEFIKDPKKSIIKTTIAAYWNFMRTSVVSVFPTLALSLSGETTISQEQPVRKPDEHVESHAEAGEATQEAESFELVSATGSSIEPGYVYKKFTITRPK